MQVQDIKRLQRTLAEGLAEYNETNPGMDLVLFDDAVRHVCRIARIIFNPGGHALLVGVGGSGGSQGRAPPGWRGMPLPRLCGGEDKRAW